MQQIITGIMNNRLNICEDMDNEANKNLAFENPPIPYIIHIHVVNITIIVIIPQNILLIINIVILRDL